MHPENLKQIRTCSLVDSTMRLLQATFAYSVVSSRTDLELMRLGCENPGTRETMRSDCRDVTSREIDVSRSGASKPSNDISLCRQDRLGR